MKFFRVFFGFVAQRFNVGMTIKRTVIKIQFGVERDNIIFLRQDERINFCQRTIFFNKSPVQINHELCNFANDFFREIHFVSHAGCLKGRKSDSGVDIFLENFFGRFGSNFFNFNAAFFRAHHNNASGFPVADETKIIFLFNIRACLNQKTFDNFAFRARLVSDKRFAQKFFGILANFV